jgi:pimeloyl-[acyl-carrier protein] methyl ester esterase
MRPTIVLLPGWACPPATLNPLAAILRSFADTAVASDGAPSAPAPGVWLAGWSLGGVKAILQASSHPGAYAGVVLIGSTARFCSADGYAAGVNPTAVRAMLRGLRRDPAAVLRDFHASSSAPHAPPELDARVAASLALGVDRLAEGLGFLLHTDARDEAKGLKLPVLVMHGAEDRIVPVAAAEWLARHVSGAVLARLDAEGHDLPLRNPARVADGISHFVRGCA